MSYVALLLSLVLAGCFPLGGGDPGLHVLYLDEVAIQERSSGAAPAGAAVAEAGFPPPGARWFMRRVDRYARTTGTSLYRVLEEGSYQGRPVHRVEIGGAYTQLYDKKTRGLIGSVRDDKSQSAASVSDTIDWPIWVGKSWRGVARYSGPRGARLDKPFEASVEEYGDVIVPAGSIKAFRIRVRVSGEDDTLLWYAPSIKIFVKSASPRQDTWELVEFLAK